MQLLINGRTVDLGPNTKLALKYTSPVVGLDKVGTSRTQSFSLPMTANNAAIFGFPARPETFAANVRQSLDATLIYAGGAIYGSFKVTAVSDTAITGSLLYGELAVLTSDEYKAKIKDVVNSSEVIALNDGVWYEQNSLNLNCTKYFNGYPAPLTNFRLPSVRVDYLINQACATLGVQALPPLGSSPLRLVLPTLNALGEHQVTGTLTSNADGTYTQPTGFNGFFANNVILATNNDGSNTHIVIALQCTTKCRLVLQCTNPYGYAQLGTLKEKKEAARLNFGWYHFPASAGGRPHTGVWLVNNKKASNVMQSCAVDWQFEVGDYLAFVYFDNTSSTGLITRPAVSLSASVEINYDGQDLARSFTGSYWTYGNYYLQPNLPDVSLSELMQYVARVNGGCLIFDGTAFSVFDYDFDGAAGRIFDVEPILKALTNVSRKAFDFGQTHTVTLERGADQWSYTQYDEDCMAKAYQVPNGLLAPTTEEVVKFLASPSMSGGGPSSAVPRRKMLSCIPCATRDANGDPFLNTIDKPVLVEGFAAEFQDNADSWIRPVEVVRNDHFGAILRLSTAIDVEVYLPMFRFLQINYKTRFTFRGGWWFCTGGTWADGVAKLTLQRYK